MKISKYEKNRRFAELKGLNFINTVNTVYNIEQLIDSSNLRELSDVFVELASRLSRFTKEAYDRLGIRMETRLAIRSIERVETIIEDYLKSKINYSLFIRRLDKRVDKSIKNITYNLKVIDKRLASLEG